MPEGRPGLLYRMKKEMILEVWGERFETGGLAAFSKAVGWRLVPLGQSTLPATTGRLVDRRRSSLPQGRACDRNLATAGVAGDFVLLKGAAGRAC